MNFRSITFGVTLLLVLLTLLQGNVCAGWAYLRVNSVTVPQRALAGRAFTLALSVEWSNVNYFVPPPYFIRVEICEGGSSDLTRSRGLAFGPSENGEKVDGSGFKTYSIELIAPERAGVWHLIAIIELRGVQTGSTMTRLWRGPWVIMSWGDVDPWQEFDVGVFDRVLLTVQTEPRISRVPVSIDGESMDTDASGMIGTEVPIAGSHTVVVPLELAVRSGSRIVFVRWSDGSTANARNIVLTDDTTLTAEYEAQYFLTVDSEMGNPQGLGWYDEGSIATFSVKSPLPVEGLMGILGGKYVFDRWGGDSNATSPTASVFMDRPKTVEAQWHTDSTILYIESAVATAIAVLATLFLVMRTKGPARLPHAKYLVKLEELKAKGIVSDEVYQKLRKEYENGLS